MSVEPTEESLAAELAETDPSRIHAATAEPIAVKVTRYRCPFCRRSWSSRKRAADHIGRCWLNPEARGCKTCEHWQAHYWEPIFADTGERVACYELAEACRADVDISAGLRVNCPLWKLREDPA